jgi:hypothetical protein
MLSEHIYVKCMLNSFPYKKVKPRTISMSFVNITILRTRAMKKKKYLQLIHMCTVLFVSSYLHHVTVHYRREIK